MPPNTTLFDCKVGAGEPHVNAGLAVSALPSALEPINYRLSFGWLHIRQIGGRHGVGQA